MDTPRYCAENGCAKTNVIAKGLCWMHYRRQLRHGSTQVVLNSVGRPVHEFVECKEPGCSEIHFAKGYCDKHYRKRKAEARLSHRICVQCGRSNDRAERHLCSSCLRKASDSRRRRRQESKGI